MVLAWGFAKLGRIGWPLVAVNVLMLGSAVVTGGHYLDEVVTGGGIAAGAIWAALRLQVRLAFVSA